ncbi:kirola-like [Cucumis melo var. makuwa]|uniref:Kirola-like n=1 Tax=Cucumis melo var. makuwa TaxID=1194695 RepID=A0A5D3C0E8_CUCMM|nr:kirola-like [Cucumis melo var. makuwa]
MVPPPSDNADKCIPVNSTIVYATHALLLDLHTPFLPPQTGPTIPSMQPSSSSAAYIAPYAPIRVLPPNSERPPPLLPSNLYALPTTDLSYYLDVNNLQIPTFEIATIEATLRTTFNTPIPMYFENPVIAFPTLSSSYVRENASPIHTWHCCPIRYTSILYSR